MNLTKCIVSFAGMMLALGVTMTAARAQAAPPPEATTAQAATPAPVATLAPTGTQTPSPMDIMYDGRTHITVAPYVWLPSISSSFQFQVPTLGTRPPTIIENSVTAGPSNYLPKVNSALMLSADVRKGPYDFFGDLIYLNASTSSTIHTTFSGPLGLVQIPVTFNANAHMSVALWEAAVGYTFAQGHNADFEGFVGYRQFPLNIHFDYRVIVAQGGIFAPSGSVSRSAYANDVIFGVRGRAFLSTSRFFVPYYLDYGTGGNNQSWEGFAGGGYAFNHGQSLVVLWRALNYNSFPPNFHVQKMSMYGPLLGYTLQI
jgi:hypothetical protein